MTKLEMAHDWAMKVIGANVRATDAVDLVDRAWKYADAMQAEADKRSDMERPAVLQDEWQPDWSVAPQWANYWAKSRGCAYLWLLNKPIMKEDYFASHGEAQIAPSFGYQGSWENSLRKRP